MQDEVADREHAHVSYRRTNKSSNACTVFTCVTPFPSIHPVCGARQPFWALSTLRRRLHSLSVLWRHFSLVEITELFVSCAVALPYKRKGRGFDSRWDDWDFSFISSSRTMAVMSIQPLTELNEYQCVRLTAFTAFILWLSRICGSLILSVTVGRALKMVAFIWCRSLEYMQRAVSMTDKWLGGRNRSTRRNPHPSAICVHHKSHVDWSGIEPVSPRWDPGHWLTETAHWSSHCYCALPY
jgi:hypothetical protein